MCKNLSILSMILSFLSYVNTDSVYKISAMLLYYT